MNEKFFNNLDKLVASNGYSIDRAKGSEHPRYPEYIYPLDYGYINKTTSTDNAEIDAWVGSNDKKVTGIIVTFDPIKNDSEMKICIGCSKEELQTAVKANNRGDMTAILVRR